MIAGQSGMRRLAKRLLPAALWPHAVRLHRVALPFLIALSGRRAELLDTPTGRYWVPRDAPYDTIIRHIKAGALFESETIELVRRFISPGDSVIDVGANLGQMTVQFSSMVGARGRVFACEANPILFELLARTIAENRCTNVVAVFGAVGEVGGGWARFPRPRFWRHANYGSYGIAPNKGRGMLVPTVALDDLDIRGRVGFLKIDTQGSDLRVMRGARRLIAAHRMPILFEHEAEYDDAFNTSFSEYAAYIAQVGYKVSETFDLNRYLAVPCA